LPELEAPQEVRAQRHKAIRELLWPKQGRRVSGPDGAAGEVRYASFISDWEDDSRPHRSGVHAGLHNGNHPQQRVCTLNRDSGAGWHSRYNRVTWNSCRRHANEVWLDRSNS